jgi:hypothetical protein
VDTLIVRTVPRAVQTAVTVVGLRPSTTPRVVEEVELWLEIPRVPQPVTPPVAE